MAIRYPLITLLLCLALAACASNPVVPARSAAIASRSERAPLVAVTGSRIPVPVRGNAAAPQSAAPLQILSDEDLQRTGRNNLAEALRTLLPSTH